MPSLPPNQRQYSKVTVRQTGLIPHHLLYHNPHDRKNDHSCSEYSTRNSDSVTPHIHHQARGARLGVNLRNRTPCVYTFLGRGFFFGRKCAGGTHVCSFFMCVLRVLHYIQISLPFGVLFARAWTLGTALLCYNPYARVRTIISVLPRTSAAPASFSFSRTNNFPSISSHLTSNFHYQSINCPMPHYHPTISVLLLTLEGVKSPLLLSSMFFVSLLLCSFDPWCAPLLSSRGTTFSRSGRPTPLLSPHPHTFFRKFHTYKHIHTHISSPHTPGFTISSKCQTKKKSALAPLLRAPRIMYNNRRASCRWGRACMYHFVQCSFHFSL